MNATRALPWTALGGLLAPAAMAATLHVAPGGTSSACAAKAPCGTIQAAVDAARAGDTIEIAAGRYVENVTVPVDKARLRLRGAGPGTTHVIAAGGGAAKKEAPTGTPADVVFDIVAPGVSVERLAIEHPSGTSTRRDVGVLVRPSAEHATVRQTVFTRSRSGETLEPTDPGSRAVLVMQAAGAVIADNTFNGNYEDAIHVPASDAQIEKNRISDARRLGIAIVQDSTTSVATRNRIAGNTVQRSGADGIQIQGDGNTVTGNTVRRSGGAGIRLCGAEDCVAPGASSVANDNTVARNNLSGSAAGDVVDHGAGNTVR